MELLVVVLALAAFVGWRWHVRSRGRRLIDEQWDLRFPTLGEGGPPGDTLHIRTFVDLERMLLVEERSDWNFHTAQVFHLRRRDGPVWETREEYESRERSWKDHKTTGPSLLAPAHHKEEETRLKDVEGWYELRDFMRLETAYQVFLRRHDPQVIFPRSPVDIAVGRVHSRTAATIKRAASATGS
jgi:hypothetical protein